MLASPRRSGRSSPTRSPPTIDHGAAYPDEQTSVCAQIAICTPPNHDHSFDNGYAAIADVVYAASGYGTPR